MQDPGGADCGDLNILARCEASEGGFAFHSEGIGRLRRQSLLTRLVLKTVFWSVVVTAEGELERPTAPPTLISTAGCNWAKSVLLSDFPTVK